MEPRAVESVTERHNRHRAMEAERALMGIEEGFDENPAAMRYFYDLFRNVYEKGQSPITDKPLIGTMCVQIPEELIYAAGAAPVRLCDGFYTDDQIGAEFMPAKSCSLVKSTLGMLSAQNIPYAKEVSLLINPATCDQKKKAGGIIREMGYTLHDMDIPANKESEAAREYWRRSVRELARVLPKTTGQAITRKSLKAAIARIAAAQTAFRRLLRLRETKPAPILGKDIFLVTNAYFFDDIERWTAAVNVLCEEVEKRVAEGFSAAQRRSPRIVFTGSPPIFPNLKLPVLIERSGGVIVADETCSSNRMLYDMVSVDEWFVHDMVDSVADRYLKPCTCPIFTQNDDRKRRLIELVRRYGADGVVYQSFAGCQVYEMEQRSIAKALEEAGIPMLYVETDYSPDDAGQLSTRIEAFIESLKSRKRKKA